MSVIVVAVFHGKKQEGVLDYSAAVAANPTLTMTGLDGVQNNLLPQLKEMGDFSHLFSSRMARALDTASVLAMDMDLEIKTLKGLGQAGNLDNGMVVMYPGHENDDPITWQDDVIHALYQIEDMVDDMSGSEKQVLVVSHRPVIAAMVALALNVHNKVGIQQIIDSHDLVGDGYRIFKQEHGQLTLIK